MQSTAHVATTSAPRYLKQICEHLGRRAESGYDTESGWIQLDVGRCTLTALETELRLDAEAPDEESLRRVEHVVGSHLERFGQRNELVVTWAAATHTDSDPDSDADSDTDTAG